jgi:hypothetical protein
MDAQHTREVYSRFALYYSVGTDIGPEHNKELEQGLT